MLPLLQQLQHATQPADLPLVRAALHKRLVIAPAGSVEHVRSAAALTLFGQPQADELVKALPRAPDAEGRLIATMLLASTKPAGQTRPAAAAILKQLASLAETKDVAVHLRARCTALAITLGDLGAANRVLAMSPDPTPRAALLHDFVDWSSDVPSVAAMLPKLTPDARAGMCIAIGRVPVADVPPAAKAALLKQFATLYQQDPSGAVHSAAEFVLRQWQAEIPKLPAIAGYGDVRGEWFVGRDGLTMARAPGGFAVLGEERDRIASVPTWFSQAMYVSTTEVPTALFKQFVDDPAVAEDRSVGWAKARPLLAPPMTDAATGMTLLEAAKFCNWLSVREGRRPAYTFDGEQPARWHIDYTANGYRVPTSAEWEYLARAGSERRFACSDDGEFLQDVAATSPPAARARNAPGLQPNRWGLFNTLGGVREMCFEINLNPGGSMANLQPVVDPLASNGGRYAIVRGGAVGGGPDELRLALAFPFEPMSREPLHGFRVICCAAEPGSPPDAPPPQDVGELWMWASKARPTSPIISVRAADWIAAWAQKHGSQRDFARAAEYFQKAAELKKDDLILWWYVASVKLIAGDRAAHHAAIEQMQRILLNNESAGNCDRTSKAMLLDPAISGPDLHYATDRAMRALELDSVSNNRGWFFMNAGVAHYRNGRYAEAIEHLKKAREAMDYAPAQVQMDLYQAMSLMKLKDGNKEEARQIFTRAKQVLDQNAPLDAADWTIKWIDWAYARQPFYEAEPMFK